MKKEDVKPWDWKRILLGEAPPEFLIEVLIRTLIIYLALLIVVRLMGKRMSGQLTLSELAVMVTLGAIASPPMQIPTTGLLLGMMALILALLFQRGLNLMEFKSEKFERVSQGEMTTLVKDGIIQLKELDKTKVSRQQLFASLRNENIFNLGEVDRVYLEACGMFSIYKKEEPAPGLLVFPPQDTAINDFSQEIRIHKMVCSNCGNVSDDEQAQQPCSVCSSTDWGQATSPVYNKSNTEHSNT